MIAGTLVGGRFALEREAASGGMGSVFRATDRVAGGVIALKLLRGQDSVDIERFTREAAILAELHHPGIVRYVAHGVTPTGEHYLAMEWLDGEDLATRLYRGGLSASDSLRLLGRAADALGFAHERGLVHRDVKPSNLFLVGRDADRVKVLDFGIARPARDTRRLTRTGALLGTPGYVAPEQVQGPPTNDPRTDVFSLGCVLFECLAGRPAFEGAHPMAVLAKLLLQEAPRLHKARPELPAELDALVARMLAKDPADRPRDAGEVRAELDALDLGRGPPSADASVAWAPFEPGPSSLTLSEQRLVSVVLAGNPDADEGRPGPRLPPAELCAAIELCGGQLNALAGDSMLVTMWGPGSAVDRAERAAQCAMILRVRMPGVPICVASGRGLVSARMVEGEVIDRGVSVLRATRPGPVHLDDVTAGMLGARFQVDREGDAFLLRGESAVLETSPLLLGKVTACVGRSRELSTLEGVFAGCVEERVASAVLVTGPAGAGKSRLRHEFLEKLRAHRNPVQILSGAAHSLGTSSPFGMVADALRRDSGIHDAEPLELRRQKLGLRLGRHVAAADLARVTAFLGEMVGAPFPDQDDQALRAARDNPLLMSDAMRTAWEDWLAAECAARPVLLVLEDLHRGDAATVRLVDSTLRNLRDLPLMVLVLARPEVLALFPGLWEERDVQLVKLGPLSKRASEKLVEDALGKDVSPEAVARIVDRADGNPFYLEELIRAVAAGRAEVFPDSVLGTVEARLDAEGSEAKRVLRAASVFGERFAASGVATLLGGERHTADVTEWLGALAARELVVPAGGEAEGYRFRHAIVREAAYATLTDADRVLGHRLAAEWLDQAGQADAAAMAEHLRRGHRPELALRWYLHAAEQALDASDLGAALERAQRGAECGAEGEELGELRLIEAEANVWRGELAVAEDRSVEAAALFPPGSSSWFRAVKQAVIAAAKLGGYDRVARWVEPASAATPAPGARGAQLSCLGECATQLIFGGRYAEADRLIAAIDRAAGDMQRLDAQVAALLQQLRAVRANYAGDLGACLEGFEAALAAFEQAGDRRNACVIRSNLGFIFAELGDFVGAEEALRAAFAGADRMGLHDLAMVALHNLGHALAQGGHLEEARRLEQRAVDEFRRLGDPRMEGVARTYLAEIALLSGDLEAAERDAGVAAEALSVAPPLRARAVAVRARALLRLGHTEEALRAAEEAHGILESLGVIEEGESLVRLVYAEALGAAGRTADLAQALGAAEERLLERAAKISDLAWRDRFLAGVPENARTLALAAAATDATDPGAK